MRDPFLIFGLSQGRYPPTVIVRRYHALRAPLVTRMGGVDAAWDVRQKLDDLHWAYRILVDPRSQARMMRVLNGEGDRAESLRLYIEASLEDGLLRASRRAEILTLGRALGISEFHTQLLIAQTQFGDAPGQPSLFDGAVRDEVGELRRNNWRALGTLTLATLMFCLMARFLTF